jgi:glucan phosphoethanolaminetransferase (alkaline phosphatase superfamily)
VIGSPGGVRLGAAGSATVAVATVPQGPARGSAPAPAQSTGSLVWWLVLAGLYVLWAYLHEHERVREAVKPENIKVNLHNLFVIVLSVLVAMPLLKIATAKFAVWFPGLKPILQPLAEIEGSA